VEEQRLGGDAEFARPLAVAPAERVEERLFDAILLEKWHTQSLGERATQRRLA
jgi:hypothetical protein